MLLEKVLVGVVMTTKVMSKESDSILDARQQGWHDRKEGKPYKNPYNKNRERYKHRAYKNGYYE